MSAVAFLVYAPQDKTSRRKSNSFDWNSNAGAYMVMDCLRRAGIEVVFCSPETAHHHKVVLISLTSTFDVWNLIRATARLTTWRKRSFRAVVGGFGAQNITPLRHYVDVAVFGRAEAFIVDLVRAQLKGRDFKHPSVMNLEAGLHPVMVAQAPGLYPHELPTQPTAYREIEIGCPRRCLFCHYSFARRHLKSHDKGFQGAWNWGSKEVLFNRVLEDCDLNQMVRTALDGLSEKLRMAFNKPYSDELIRETTRELSLRWKGKLAWLKVYLIGSYPSEGPEDLERFEELIRSLEAPGKPVYFTFHATPFRPSPLTPSAYLPANIGFGWHQMGGRKIIKTDQLRATWSATMEGPFAHLQSLIVERALPETDEIINAALFNTKLAGMRAAQRIEALGRNFNLAPYLREYRTGEELPASYLNSYTPSATVKKMARKLKAKLGMPEPAPQGGA